MNGMLDPLEIFFRLGEKTFLILISLQLAFFNASAWNTAWLCIYYCVRLVNFSHPYLLKMKATLLSSVPQLIVGSVLGSVAINLPFICWMIVLMYPTAQGLILIQGNPKLKSKICAQFTFT
ncbi:taste receptor type 2 member 41-like [Pyxicephalus adspersus]|uniref:taste receptor type 2 member 41-like n=1 Tax=Pyxicephalus adspersus TaxID=30357 RepID=UPI003B5C84E0